MIVYEVSINRSVETFITKLEKHTIAKTLRTIDLLERFGFELTFPHTKKIDKNLHELRIRSDQEVRIFYTFKNNAIVLLHGFVKKTQRTPSREIEQARQELKSSQP